MFRRVKTISPTHNIKFKGITHAHIQNKLSKVSNKKQTLNLDMARISKKPIMLTPFEVKNGY